MKHLSVQGTGMVLSWLSLKRHRQCPWGREAANLWLEGEVFLFFGLGRAAVEQVLSEQVADAHIIPVIAKNRQKFHFIQQQGNITYISEKLEL